MSLGNLLYSWSYNCYLWISGTGTDSWSVIMTILQCWLISPNAHHCPSRFHLDRGPSRDPQPRSIDTTSNRDISRCWLLIGVSSHQSPWILGRVVSNISGTTLHQNVFACFDHFHRFFGCFWPFQKKTKYGNFRVFCKNQCVFQMSLTMMIEKVLLLMLYEV